MGCCWGGEQVDWGGPGSTEVGAGGAGGDPLPVTCILRMFSRSSPCTMLSMASCILLCGASAMPPAPTWAGGPRPPRAHFPGQRSPGAGGPGGAEQRPLLPGGAHCRPGAPAPAESGRRRAASAGGSAPAAGRGHGLWPGWSGGSHTLRGCLPRGAPASPWGRTYPATGVEAPCLLEGREGEPWQCPCRTNVHPDLGTPSGPPLGCFLAPSQPLHVGVYQSPRRKGRSKGKTSLLVVGHCWS